jgi:putative phosphoribosyl transferase
MAHAPGKDQPPHPETAQSIGVRIPAGKVMLEGDLGIAQAARGVVLFAHGSGSSRHSPRNRYVAQVLRQGGLATLLFDLLTGEEELIDMRTAKLRFDIGLLAQRLLQASEWAVQQPQIKGLPMGYFGASTGAAAALVAAAKAPHPLAAVVSRGGRPDLAGAALPQVQTPTLLIVGEEDVQVLELNRRAMNLLRCEKRLETVPGATHLFEEPGTLQEVARLARAWFSAHFEQRQGRPHVA